MSRRYPTFHGRAFTLVELLVTIVIVAVLAMLLLPALRQGKRSAHRAQCVNNLRQLGIAARLYFDEHDGETFLYRLHPTNGGTLFWFGWLQNGADGNRDFDAKQGPLYPYVLGRGVELCPSLGYGGPNFKYKARGAAYGYGYNIHISTNAPNVPRNIDTIRDTSGTALFADAAQVNDFLPPASATRPMLEEFFYVDAGPGSYPNGHFRHNQRANVAFLDGHVDTESAVSGTIDPKLRSAWVGRLRAAILKPAP